MREKFTILILILLLAGFLRFWQLGKVPASPDWDEAALAYNAYSLMKTGRDEYGKPFPLILRSFDDYKPAAYAYLAIPAIKVFGLNTFAVRFPSALLGTLAVLMTFFLAKELFSETKEKIIYSLLAAFFLAVSPWHLQFSRAAFESNLGVFFNILIVLFFLKGLKKPWFLVLSAFFAGLNIYAYQAEKIFGPFLVLAMALIWRRELLKTQRRYLGTAIIIGLLLLLPFCRMAVTTPEIFLRAKGTSFASDITPFLARTVEKLIRDHQSKDYLGLILDNRRVIYVLSFIQGYLSHFNFNWLFIAGDDTRHHAPGMGLLYLWELPFLLLGIYSLIFGKFSQKTKLLVFAWFFLAPFPAAFSSGAPHAVRALRFLPVMQIFIALGIVSFWQLIKRKHRLLKISLVSLGIIFFVFNFSYYLNQYFVQLNYFTSQAWQYGYEPAIEEIKKVENKYEKIIVSNQQPLDQSYMFFLFYLKYDPAAYLQEGGTVSGGYAEEANAFSKFTFRPINWSEEEKGKKILFIGRPNDFPSEGEVIKTINYLDGEPAMKFVKGG